MRTNSVVAMSVMAGIVVGGAAVHPPHAQAKPKAYIVTEFEVVDAAAQVAYGPVVQAAQKAGGGRPFRTAGGKIVAFQGEPPKRVAITEWDSLEQAEAYQNS